VITNYPQYFASWDLPADGIFGTLSGSLLSYDQTFILPLALMAMNYRLIKHSEHPFLINMRNKWSPLATMLFVVYSSCVTIVLPQAHLVSYMAYVGTHIMVRGIRRALKERKERKRLSSVFKVNTKLK
jgi:hypothetical protein